MMDDRSSHCFVEEGRAAAACGAVSGGGKVGKVLSAIQWLDSEAKMAREPRLVVHSVALRDSGCAVVAPDVSCCILRQFCGRDTILVFKNSNFENNKHK